MLPPAVLAGGAHGAQRRLAPGLCSLDGQAEGAQPGQRGMPWPKVLSDSPIGRLADSGVNKKLVQDRSRKLLSTLSFDSTDVRQIQRSKFCFRYGGMEPVLNDSPEICSDGGVSHSL
jgi:hypothetical protein